MWWCEAGEEARGRRVDAGRQAKSWTKFLLLEAKARRLPYSLLARLFLVPPLCLDWP